MEFLWFVSYKVSIKKLYELFLLSHGMFLGLFSRSMNVQQQRSREIPEYVPSSTVRYWE